ncbi:MAG TPA: hypothetical protein VN421_05935 [Pseudoflavonifractor sp.]|nr:hypothetical protein [Pseudoflavonifractor sp.]
MATYEENALITVKDAAGNKYLLYPITKLECVEGLPDLDAGANGQALAKVAGALAWKSFTAADVGARPSTWTPTAADVGAVPTSRKVNSKALTTDITLTAADVGARASTWTPTAADVGASPTSHVHGAITSDGKIGTTADLPVFTGTGGALATKTAAAARTALAALGVFGPTAITISATWSGSGPWTQNVTVSGVTAAMDWRLGLHLAKITDDAARKLQEKAFGCITWCETYAGGITLTCRDKKPDVAISAVLAGEV